MSQLGYRKSVDVDLHFVNMFGTVYFSHFAGWQGIVREHFLREHCPALLQRLHEDLELVTLEYGCKMLAPVGPFQQVEIVMTLGRTTATRMTMEFDYFVQQDGEAVAVARGSQTIACFQKPEGVMPRKPLALPDELLFAARRFPKAA